MLNIQLKVFLVFIIDGIIIGILFDIFRIARKSFKTGVIITAIQDIIFWILTGIITLYSIFTFNNGIIRGYMFIGIVLGFITYLLTLSNIFVKTNVFIVEKLKKIISIIANIFLYPTKIIYRILLKIYALLHKKIRKIDIKSIFIKNKTKNSNLKEGF